MNANPYLLLEPPAVWGGKLHWYVPDDLDEYQKEITNNIESERDSRVKNFIAVVKGMR